jgi:hypothetical protein
MRVKALRAIALRACPEMERAALAETLDARDAHARQGARAQASGAAWEAWLTAQHQLAEHLGIVHWIRKVGPPSTAHVVGGRVQHDARGRMLAAVTGTALPDYVGVLRGGRALVVEAKRRTGRLHADPAHRDGIAAHQQAILRATSAAGGVALVVVEFVRASGPTRFAVPWERLEERWTCVRGGPRSVGPTELAGCDVPPWGCYLQRFDEVCG